SRSRRATSPSAACLRSPARAPREACGCRGRERGCACARPPPPASAASRARLPLRPAARSAPRSPCRAPWHQLRGMSARRIGTVVVLAGVWADAAFFLWRSTVPGDLPLSGLAVDRFFSAGEVAAARRYARFTFWNELASLVVPLVVL